MLSWRHWCLVVRTSASTRRLNWRLSHVVQRVVVLQRIISKCIFGLILSPGVQSLVPRSGVPSLRFIFLHIKLRNSKFYISVLKRWQPLRPSDRRLVALFHLVRVLKLLCFDGLIHINLWISDNLIHRLVFRCCVLELLCRRLRCLIPQKRWNTLSLLDWERRLFSRHIH